MMNKNDELCEKLQAYVDLKEYIKEYNKEQVQKGLDLGVRIIQDLLREYPYEIGTVSIEWEDNYHKEELVVRLGIPFDNNRRFRKEEAIKYILKRYPDVKSHYLGFQVAKCISKRNIGKFIEEIDDD